MNSKSIALNISTMAFLLILLSVVPALGQQSQYIMASGPTGGVWYPIASAMVDLCQNKAGITLTQQTGGGISNAVNVSSGKAHFGWTTADVAKSAMVGSGEFQGKALSNLRLVGVLYPQEYNLVVFADSGIRKVQDMRGRRLVTTSKGSSTELMTKRVLEAHGLKEEDLKQINHTNLTDGVNLLKDGHADAMSHLITNPAAYVMDLASAKPVWLVSLDPDAVKSLVEKFPGYTATTIEAGIYKGQTEKARSINSPVMLVSREEMEEETVYKVTRALFENVSQLRSVHSVMEHLSPEKASKDPVIPIHKGALKYYKEVGSVK